MDKNFNSAQIEEKWSKFWLDNKLFAPQSNASDGKDSQAEPYCIVIPPPNVTGTLHMGHAFLNTIIDTIIRHQRMRGKNVLWQMGTDHAGIATQMVVERRLAAEGKSKNDIGREKFIEEVWKWKEYSAGTIEKQLRRLGTSVDWDSSRFTMDEDYIESVLEAFVRLHEMGLIYRKKRLVNWDPVLKTAVSDLEVRAEEEPATLYFIRYHFADKNVRNSRGEDHMTIATTRPETTLADGAVAVNPGDERYTDVVGQMVLVPGTDRIIPVITDDYVKPEFGSGCVKITPAHDYNDYEVGQRHTMETINLFTEEAKLNENAPPRYQGMDRYEAREKVLQDFRDQNLLAKEQKHSHSPPRGDRSGVILEPYLTEQWFIKMDDLAKRGIVAVRNKETAFISPMWEKVYYTWLDEIQDWCISRQLWWGHRIPAWFDDAGNVYVGRNEEEVRAKHKLAADTKLNHDPDVLDTWFSSALWTFATMGWPQETERQKTFNPTNLLVTGFDIIFFWVARMIMMTLCLKDEVPFKEVYIHGLVRDAEGQKMSKSKGNILDPLDIIDGVSLDELLRKRTTDMMQPDKAKKISEQTKKHFPEGIAAHGTDALRFTFCAMASTGRDLNFDTSRCIGYRNFCNKLWNAARYVTMQDIEGEAQASPQTSPQTSKHAAELSKLNDKIHQWMELRLKLATSKINQGLETYRIDLAAQALYELIWHEYCDWYIELVKPIFLSAAPSERKKIRDKMLQILEEILRLAHPFIPFITEEIWQEVQPLLDTKGADKTASIMTSEFPYEANISDKEIESQEAKFTDISWLQTLVQSARILRSENNIPPKQELDFRLDTPNKDEQKWLEQYRPLLSVLIKATNIELLSGKQAEAEGMSVLKRLAGKGELIALFEKGAGIPGIDAEQEKARLEKKINEVQGEIAQLNAKLNNENFTAKAPAAIVDGVKQKLEGKTDTLAKLEAQLKNL